MNKQKKLEELRMIVKKMLMNIEKNILIWKAMLKNN